MLSTLTTKGKKKGGREKKLVELMDKFMVLIVMMVSQVYTYFQMHQFVFIKSRQFFLYKSLFNKAA